MISLESFFFFVGAIYSCKLVFNLLLSIKDGLNAFVFPKIFEITNFKEKYGEWAVITGCTQGIGKCYAEELAQRGMNIVLVSRSQSKLDDVAKEISEKYGVGTKIIVADFTKPEVLPMIVQKIEAFEIDVGVLVNNVGLLGPHHMPFLELDQQTVIDMVNVNVLAATVLCHSMLPKMKTKGKGAIINISSLGAYFFIPYLAEYAATKHYMSAFTQAIAAEYSDSGVTIQCIEPGSVETKMTEHFDEEMTKFGYPTPETYTKAACQTLGFSARTSGYWSHSFFNWLVHFFITPTENSIVISQGAKSGKQTYEYALARKQKTN